MFENSTILITGGTGTVGEELVNILLAQKPRAIRIFSRDEHKQFLMQNKYKDNNELRFLIGDIRDFERVLRAMKNVDYVFHLAAMKHVPACEYNPYEAVKTNVIGTQNVINASVVNEVKRVVFTSSDKAISPTNAMGATKLLAERLIIAANYSKGGSSTIFSSVRFGNVMGSRGSVIPFFKNQILTENKITITNKDMTRFMMSVKEAARLTVNAMEVSKGGEIFVLKMPILRIGDLAEVVIEETIKKYAHIKALDEVKIEIIGLRPGEKMYEELMTKEEAEYAFEMTGMYAVLNEKHISYDNLQKTSIENYSSTDGPVISKEEIRQIIIEENLI